MKSLTHISFACLLALLSGGCLIKVNAEIAPAGNVRFSNPAGLHANPAFSQVATVDGRCRLVFVGGQNAVVAVKKYPTEAST